MPKTNPILEDFKIIMEIVNQFPVEPIYIELPPVQLNWTSYPYTTKNED